MSFTKTPFTKMPFTKLLLTAAIATLLSAAGAAAQTEIKFGHVGEPGSLFDRSAQEFAKRANAKLGDKAKVVVYGSSQLGGDSELMKKLKLGTVDLALPSTVMSSQVPLFGLFEMPYLVKDRDHMAKIRDQIVDPTLVPAAAKSGYRIIATWENGFRQITNSKHPIVKPEDLAGLKLRVPQGGWRVKMFQAYGANPSPLALSEVFVALQTGVMDAPFGIQRGDGAGTGHDGAMAFGAVGHGKAAAAGLAGGGFALDGGCFDPAGAFDFHGRESHCDTAASKIMVKEGLTRLFGAGGRC